MQFSILVLMTAAVAVQAANNVKQKVVYTATGASAVVGNGFGCAHITPAGAASQLGCVKHVFTNGFTVGVTDEKTKAVTLCSIAGTSGACGPAGVNVQVDLTGGTGVAPPPSGPAGTKSLTPAQLVNLPIAGSAAPPPATGTTPAAVPATSAAKATGTPCVTPRAFVA